MALFQQRMQQQHGANLPSSSSSTQPSLASEEDLPTSTTQEPKTPKHDQHQEAESTKAKNPYSIDAILKTKTTTTSTNAANNSKAADKLVKRRLEEDFEADLDAKRITPEKRVKLEENSEEEELKVEEEDDDNNTNDIAD